MFAQLLIVSTVAGYYGTQYAPEEFMMYMFILFIQLICILNLIIADPRPQSSLHDAFVYVIVYGLLCSTNVYTQHLVSCIAFAMVSTRIAYNRCIFLWWNTERNIDYDVIVSIMTLVCLMRSESLIRHWLCWVIGFASHFFSDVSSNSVILKMKMIM